MSYALIADGEVVSFPYSVDEFRKAQSLRTDGSISLPIAPTPEQLAEVGLFSVTYAPAPQLEDNQVLTGELELANVDGQWTATPTFRTLSIEEVAQQLALRREGMVVEMAQARLALLSYGITADMVDAKIASMPSPQKEAAKIEWEYRTTVRRLSQLVLAIGSSLGLDDEQIDNLFALAETL